MRTTNDPGVFLHAHTGVPAACAECGHVCVLRPRKLCNRCYTDPKVLARHLSLCVAGWDTFSTRPEAMEASTAEPGTRDKIEDMRERYGRHEQLHRPGDKTVLGADYEYGRTESAGRAQSQCQASVIRERKRLLMLSLLQTSLELAHDLEEEEAA